MDLRICLSFFACPLHSIPFRFTSVSFIRARARVRSARDPFPTVQKQPLKSPAIHILLETRPPASISTSCLLRLLHRLAPNIPINIRCIRDLSSHSLNRFPRLSRHRGRTLIRDQRIPPLHHLPYRSLHKTALTVPTPQENGIHDQQDPASLCENDGGEEDAEPEEDLKRGNEHHAGVVVFFHESADCLCQGGGFIAAPGGGGIEGWENIGASIGRNMEDRIDHERKEGEGNLAGEEPEERHSYIKKKKNHLSIHCCCYRPLGLASGSSTNRDIERFHLQPKPKAHPAGDLHPVGERGRLCRRLYRRLLLRPRRRCDKRNGPSASRN